MSVTSYEKAMIPPLISVTTPRETNEKTIFFPPRRKVAMKRPEALPGVLIQTDILILNNTASRTVNQNKSASVLPRVKPNDKQSDPGHLYMDHYASNKENLLDYDHRKKHVITTRKGLARGNKTREHVHVLPISEKMSGSKTQAKKVKIAAGSLRGRGQDGKQLISTTGDKKSASVTSGHDTSPSKLSRVEDPRSSKSTLKDGLSRNSINGKGIAKPAAVKTEGKNSKPDSLPHTLSHPKHNGGREEHISRVLPGSLEQIIEESSTKDTRRGMNHSVSPKPKGVGIERKTKTPSRGTPSASPASRTRRNDDLRDQSLDDRVQDLELPKVTMNEVLQSWNIGPARTRSSSLAGKDPMEFLRSRERSNSDPKQRMTTVEELRRCRYLRTGGKEEQELRHGRVCSCNSCEHGKGLKSTPYLNS